METSLLKSDIFFFVTTMVVVAVGVALTVGIIYVISILRLIRGISQKASKGADAVIEGIAEAKQSMKEEGYVVGSLLDIFKRVAHKNKKRKTAK